MKLVVGLGNPGAKYENSRHNMGFNVLDALAAKLLVSFEKEDFKGTYARFRGEDDDLLLFKPLTFMNLSGEAVRDIVTFFKINIEDIIIVFDDMALDPGKIRLRLAGSSGGHKGMQNIIDLLGTENIKRIRVGIGEPANHDAIDYVLSKPDQATSALLTEATDKATKAILDALTHGFHHAMSTFN